MSDSPDTSSNSSIGRNEPCPCGSGKKYKRCCGVSAAPKLGAPRAMPDMSALAGGAPGGFSPDQMDPEAMAQVAQMLQRLPKGQMQKLQSLMQQAMAGKDVSREAEAFEKTLPADFQNMLHTMKLPGMGGGDEAPAPASPDEMTPEQARALVEAAAKSGKISAAEAESLLQAPPPTPTTEGPAPAAAESAGEQPASSSGGGISRFFRRGKK